MNPDKLYRLLIDIFGEQYETRRGEFKINCINPNCNDDTGNLEISLEKRVFHCWKCGYSGKILKLLKDYLGWAPDIDEYVSPDDLRKFDKNIFEKEETENKKIFALPKEYQSLDNVKLSYVGQKALKYALTRMDFDSIMNYKVGYCGLGEYRWRIIVPALEKGTPVYFSARTFMSEKPVYKNPDKEVTGVGKEEVVFNIDGAREAGYAVLCEGVFDAIRVGKPGVAIFGTELHDAQILKLIEAVNKFYVLLDGDYAGIKAAVKVARKIISYGEPVNVVILPSGDPADWPKDFIDGLVSSSVPFDFLQEIEINLKTRF